jgi:hypothetical protein
MRLFVFGTQKVIRIRIRIALMRTNNDGHARDRFAAAREGAGL